MAHLVDLTQKPYCLDAQAITWVESTIASMNLDEKNWSTFCQYGI